jgi:hypothetical protein
VKRKTPTRKDLIEELATRHRLTKKAAGELLNQVLLEVHSFSTPLLENDWTGADVLHQLHRWMGLRP